MVCSAPCCDISVVPMIIHRVCFDGDLFLMIIDACSHDNKCSMMIHDVCVSVSMVICDVHMMYYA